MLIPRLLFEYRRLAISLAVIVVGTIALSKWMTSRGDSTHVILISIDTLRHDHLGCYGYPRDTSPRLDELAADGILFEAAFCPATNTAPSHATILTGLHTFSHGVLRNRDQLRDGVKTLAQHLGAAGFRSGAFVSGFTLQKKHTNLDRGFGHYDDELTRLTERLAKQTLQAAVGWLKDEAHQRAPNLLFVHFFDPHCPYAPPAEFARRFTKPGRAKVRAGRLHHIRAHGGRPDQLEEYVRSYDSEVAYTDAMVGELVDALDRHGFWDEALVIFLGDHGETLGDRSWPFDHGARVFEEQIRVPLIIRLPRDEAAGRRIEVPVHHVDILPTILDYLQLPIPPELHGRSLLPLIRAQEPGDSNRPILSTARPEPERVPEIRAPLTKKGLILTLRAWPDKLIAYPCADSFYYQLFDLAQDPGEKSSLANTRPQRVAQLAERLHAWIDEVGGGAIPAEPILSPEEEEALETLGYVRD